MRFARTIDFTVTGGSTLLGHLPLIVGALPQAVEVLVTLEIAGLANIVIATSRFDRWRIHAGALTVSPPWAIEYTGTRCLALLGYLPLVLVVALPESVVVCVTDEFARRADGVFERRWRPDKRIAAALIELGAVDARRAARFTTTVGYTSLVGGANTAIAPGTSRAAVLDRLSIAAADVTFTLLLDLAEISGTADTLLEGVAGLTELGVTTCLYILPASIFTTYLNAGSILVVVAAVDIDL